VRRKANGASTNGDSQTKHDDIDAGYDSETPGSVNLHRLARAQGMNTDVRRAIFVAILSSVDHMEAHLRVLKLNLKKKQMLEVPRVIIHCAAAEDAYNPFYTLVASKFCNDHQLRKAFHFALWDVLRRMEKSDEDNEQQAMTLRQIVNFAKLYGTLIGREMLTLGALKKLSQDYAYWTSEQSMFIEVLLMTVLEELGKKSSKDFDQAVKEVFRTAAGAPEVIPALLHVLEKSDSMSELATTKRGKRRILQGCQIAIDGLEEAARAGPADQDSGDENN
jgi:nucleolar MIF4G domain-containing protein 1